MFVQKKKEMKKNSRKYPTQTNKIQNKKQTNKIPKQTPPPI